MSRWIEPEDHGGFTAVAMVTTCTFTYELLICQRPMNSFQFGNALVSEYVSMYPSVVGINVMKIV